MPPSPNPTQFRRIKPTFRSLGSSMAPVPPCTTSSTATTRAPPPLAPATPPSWNRYPYVFNSPMSNIDPTGLSDCPDLKIGCMPSNECLSGAWCGGFGVDILGGRNFWNGTPYVGIGGGANGVRGGY